jgi:hypothetical protein
MLRLFSLLKILLRIDHRLMALIGLLQLMVDNQGMRQPAHYTPNWIDNQDVMLKLKISDSTLRRLRMEGTIPYTRVRGKYYYNESDIQAIFSQNKT